MKKYNAETADILSSVSVNLKEMYNFPETITAQYIMEMISLLGNTLDDQSTVFVLSKVLKQVSLDLENDDFDYTPVVENAIIQLMIILLKIKIGEKK